MIFPLVACERPSNTHTNAQPEHMENFQSHCMLYVVCLRQTWPSPTRMCVCANRAGKPADAVRVCVCAVRQAYLCMLVASRAAASNKENATHCAALLLGQQHSHKVASLCMSVTESQSQRVREPSCHSSLFTSGHGRDGESRVIAKSVSSHGAKMCRRQTSHGCFRRLFLCGVRD